jgi:hypothetical protein
LSLGEVGREAQSTPCCQLHPLHWPLFQSVLVESDCNRQENRELRVLAQGGDQIIHGCRSGVGESGLERIGQSDRTRRGRRNMSVQSCECLIGRDLVRAVPLTLEEPHRRDARWSTSWNGKPNGSSRSNHLPSGRIAPICVPVLAQITSPSRYFTWQPPVARGLVASTANVFLSVERLSTGASAGEPAKDMVWAVSACRSTLANFGPSSWL